MQDAAARLRRGARALGANLERDAAFHGGIARLARHWRLALTPMGASAPFTVDVSLPPGALPPPAASRPRPGLTPGLALSGGPAAGAPGAARADPIDLVGDAAGNVCVVAGALSKTARSAADRAAAGAAGGAGAAADTGQRGDVEGPGGTPPGGSLDAVGVLAVHAALGTEQEALLWRVVRQGLEAEVRMLGPGLWHTANLRYGLLLHSLCCVSTKMEGTHASDAT